MDNTLTRSLNNIGFTEKQSQVYLSALSIGEATVSQIAENTKLKRTTAFNIMHELSDKGYLSIQTKKGKQYASAISPSILLEKSQNAYTQLKTIYPQLLSIANTSPHKPGMQFFEGIQGIKHCYNQVEFATGEVIGFTNYDLMPSIVSKHIQETFIPLRKKRNIPARFITSYSDKAKEIKQYDKERNLAHLLVPNFNADFALECLLMNDEDCYFLSFESDSYYAIHIQSKSIYLMLKNIFNIIWNTQYSD